MALRMLFADEKGTVMEHPTLLAAVRSGENVLAATEVPEATLPLPSFGKLAYLPGRIPVGIDPETGEPVAGWRIPPMDLGRYGIQYGARAVVALVGLGANLPEDAVYPSAYVDDEGKPLSGANRYVLRFEPGAEPPVDAFWSVTLYDPQSFFVANPIGRQALSSWMPFHRGADGSLELLIQHASPGARQEANWLPAPEGEFNVTLRMYWPKAKPPSILDGSWKPPGIRRVK